MRRRQYLLATGAALGVAGCSSDDGEDTFDLADNNGGVRGPDDNSGDRAATRTPEPTGDAEIVRTDLISGDSIYGKIPWALIDVQNSTGTDHGEVRVQVRFYNDAGELMDTESGQVDVLPADTTWRYYQRFASQNRDQLSRIETSVMDAEPRPRYDTPSAPNVAKSEMLAHHTNGVTVTGDVKANGFSGNLEVIGLVYGPDGWLRGSTLNVRRDMKPDGTWRFEGRDSTARTPGDRPLPSHHEVRIFEW